MDYNSPRGLGWLKSGPEELLRSQWAVLGLCFVFLSLQLPPLSHSYDSAIMDSRSTDSFSQASSSPNTENISSLLSLAISVNLLLLLILPWPFLKADTTAPWIFLSFSSFLLLSTESPLAFLSFLVRRLMIIYMFVCVCISSYICMYTCIHILLIFLYIEQIQHASVKSIPNLVIFSFCLFQNCWIIRVNFCTVRHIGLEF